MEWLNIPSSITNPNSLKKVGKSLSVQAIRELARSNNIDIPLYYGGIYNKLTDTLIPILLPEEINRDHSNTIEELTTEMRSVGMPFYTGGSSPTVSFTVYLNDDFYNLAIQQGMLSGKDLSDLVDLGINLKNGSTINKVLSALRALTFPEYQSGVAKSPECVLYLGESAKYIARCTSVSDTLKGITGFSDEFKPTHREATVSLSFTILREIGITNKYGNSMAPSASDIQGGGGFGL